MARSLKSTPVDELGKGRRRRLRSSTRQAGQTGEHDLRLLEPNVRHLAAIASMPAKRRPPEPPGVVDQQQDELERVREADEVELGRCGRSATVALRESRARRKRPYASPARLQARLDSASNVEESRPCKASCGGGVNRMSYTLLRGVFVIRYPDLPRQGPEPDGDTVKFKPDSPALVETLPRVSGRAPDINARGISVRLEAIDTLETHFSETHQELLGANAARDALLAHLGFSGVTFWPDLPNKVQAADQDSMRGHVLSNGIDANGRMIGFVYPGDPVGPDGSSVFVDEALVDLSANALLLAAGHAYPAFYGTLPATLRTHLAGASRAARGAQPPSGLWPRSTADPDGPAAIADLAAAEELVVWPKLFRRIVPYFAAGFTDFDGFDAWLRADPVHRDDELFLLDRLEPGNMHDVVSGAGGRDPAHGLAGRLHHQPGSSPARRAHGPPASRGRRRSHRRSPAGPDRHRPRTRNRNPLEHDRLSGRTWRMGLDRCCQHPQHPHRHPRRRIGHATDAGPGSPAWQQGRLSPSHGQCWRLDRPRHLRRAHGATRSHYLLRPITRSPPIRARCPNGIRAATERSPSLTAPGRGQGSRLAPRPTSHLATASG